MSVSKVQAIQVRVIARRAARATLTMTPDRRSLTREEIRLLKSTSGPRKVRISPIDDYTALKHRSDMLTPSFLYRSFPRCGPIGCINRHSRGRRAPRWCQGRLRRQGRFQSCSQCQRHPGSRARQVRPKSHVPERDRRLLDQAGRDAEQGKTRSERDPWCINGSGLGRCC